VSGDEILNEYYDRIGGRDKIFEASKSVAKIKKRRRTTDGTSTAVAKRVQQTQAQVADGTLLAAREQWRPPSGSWEDEVETIGACEEISSGKLIVYLIWKNGQKTKHDTQVIYKKCPQKVVHLFSIPFTSVIFRADSAQMLQFYEQHVKIV
jgi:chromobox protein 1